MTGGWRPGRANGHEGSHTRAAISKLLAWAGSLVGVAGAGRLILTIRYFAGDLSSDRLGGILPATFLVLGLTFGVTAWLTRR